MENIMTNIKTQIDFGGFYHSIHNDVIVREIEAVICDDDGIIFDDCEYEVNFSKTHHNYINHYCRLFEDYLINEYDLNINFKNLNLWSPREYNFETDSITCEITPAEHDKLTNHFRKDDEFLDYLTEATKSYDGFISYYTIDDALRDKNGMLSVYILRYLANKFEEDEIDSFYEFTDIEFKYLRNTWNEYLAECEKQGNLFA